MKRPIIELFLSSFLLVMALPSQAAPVNFTGELRKGACTIRPGDEDISMNLGDVVNRYLYLNSRTAGEPFSLHLEGCDLSVVDGVTVTFSGTGSAPLSGLLALDPGSTASGIAIGLESQTGQLLALNTESPEYPLSPGNSEVALRVYVQGEPDAIANRSINLGTFSATATFGLSYQ